jgi:UDP-N-acetylmuramoyl-tripeptide--D-alanyl-D-alanine ligase
VAIVKANVKLIGKLMYLSTAAQLLNGQLIGQDVAFNSICIDTRILKPGELFIAIKGDNFNGHHFVATAAKLGAVAIITSEIITTDIPSILVADTRLSLGLLAAHHRQQFAIPIIGITGSCGKSTTKTMLAAILQRCGSTLAVGTLNNDIGVPLILLQLHDQHQFAVIEMGTNHPGEIAYLTKLAQPTIACIINAAPAHTEFLESVQNIAVEKGSIFNELPENGIAIINADDNFSPYWQQLAQHKTILYFGLNPSAEFSARNIKLDEEGYAEFELISPQGNIFIQLKIIGEHNVMNALAASAAAHAAGASLTAIKQGLEQFTPVHKRSVLRKGYNGAVIIDDSYNANPVAVKAVLKMLARRSGIKIFAFGDMGELGTISAQAHQEIGEEAKKLGIDYVFTYGKFSELTAQAFGKQGYYFNEQAQLISAVKEKLCPGTTTTVLVKGTRSMKMENVVAALTEE